MKTYKIVDMHYRYPENWGVATKVEGLKEDNKCQMLFTFPFPIQKKILQHFSL